MLGSMDIIAFVPTRNPDKGVSFERYPGMGQDEKGVWGSPSGAKVAWVKDPDGNVLSVTEH